jgi:hypothetical protein
VKILVGRIANSQDNEVLQLLSYHFIRMQGTPTTPTEDDEASIPTEHERSGASMNPTITVRRKAAKRTLPWKLAADEIQLALSPPQDEDTRVTKRPRLEELFPTSLEEATPENATTAFPSTDATPATADNDDANTDSVTQMQPNARTTGATGRWTFVEDAKLTSAVSNEGKKKHSNSNNWVAIAALVPGRTRIQCERRWRDALNPSIDRTTARTTGTWTEDEDIKLKAAVQAHGGKHWAAIAALVSGRTQIQCRSRWHNTLDPSIDQMTGSTGKWKEEEDIKLKAAVQTHGGKNWVTIAALVPGRTRIQCSHRWHDILGPSITRVNGCKGAWKENEDIKLKAAVHMHGGKNWVAIAALVPGRTRRQCWDRWKKYMDPNRSTVRK